MRKSPPSFLLVSSIGPTRRTIFPVFLARWHRRPQHTAGGSHSFGAAATSGDITPPLPDSGLKLPFRFETGLSLFAKRTPRPFPPPFLSPPSGSFSDPLSTHHRSRDKRASVGGEPIRGRTNGDDAVYASDYFICANDGVGAWSARPRGHAGLWSRLILHFWVAAMQEDMARSRSTDQPYRPDPIRYLQHAYERTIEATSGPNGFLGTTTAAGAQLFYKTDTADPTSPVSPLLYVTNLGDSQIMVVRPKSREMVYKSKEQWHWFDCPRQLGTNSPDTPVDNAVLDTVELMEGDVVLAMSDGVIDNLWGHEIVENVSKSVERWEAGEGGEASGPRKDGANGGMLFVAQELVNAAKQIATDPFAESPFMEHATEEGLASEGGKLDDISVVAALCQRNAVP
ncbi:phosphatase 2C-like domain-containing protein [Durotheca rogersii]|uniref:phosphatase 2C-like domain-containing protein n=1 Tax=Durotheca rogersii TaxID=419775 RepID=UPI00221EE808|nr:phosphatase 2C-like domain-containing protein [Durotheca rogersii]KAI5862608.1 phosphatase 2C-like domain-containing protein [Durotheca rogersii]